MKLEHTLSSKIKLEKSIEPICVILPSELNDKPHRKVKFLPLKLAGCNPSIQTPSSIVIEGNINICKYLVSNDAVSTDFVIDKGGARVVNNELVPIFFGTAWNNATPSINVVMNAIQTILDSPYLSQMNQYVSQKDPYGFNNITLHQPVQTLNNPNMPTYGTNDAGNLVWDLINSNVFPEPDEDGGRNIYMVFYPPGTTADVNTDSNVNNNICGAHYVFPYSDLGLGIDEDYAWVGFVDFSQNSGNPLDSITKTFSHELVEIISDPEGDAWLMNRSLNRGNEIGDACNNTADRVDGFLTCGYWSEKHKSCIIPKRRKTLEIDSKIDGASDQSLEKPTPGIEGELLFGTVILNELCHHGEYNWEINLYPQDYTITAITQGFSNAVFLWSLPDQKSGPSPLVDGMDGIISIYVDVWHEDAYGSSSATRLVPVRVKVRGNILVVTNIYPSVGNFPIRSNVIAMEKGSAVGSPESLSKSDSQYFEGRTLTFDNRYQKDKLECWKRFNKLWKNDVPRITPHTGPDDRRWGWVDKLPNNIIGERREFVMRGATLSALIQESQPELANEIRNKTAILGNVPIGILNPQFLHLGKIIN